MAGKRKIEIFSTGCAFCEDTVKAVRQAACPSCEITVRDMTDISVVARAKQFGIRAVPAVVIDGQLASCCTGKGVEIDVLRKAGLGQARS